MLPRVLFCLLLFASASAAQEREWVFMTSDDEAYLGFGVPDSDDAGITFSCAFQSGAIRIFIPESREHLVPGTTANIAIRAGGRDYSYSAAVAPNEEAGIPSLMADAAPGDALFAALVANDRFGVVIAGEEDMYPLAGSDFDSLLRACRKGA